MKHKAMAALHDSGVVAILRTDSADDLVHISQALVSGGIQFIEITMTVPGALEVIREASSELNRIGAFVGAGTVLDAATARGAILAGAKFVVSPGFDLETVRTCNTYGILAIPGAMTPTEVLLAWKNGADVVKIFPASLGGPDFIKALKEPLPQIEMIPTGKLTAANAPAYIKSGAIAVGVGGALVSPDLIRSRNFAQISENARTLCKLVREARAGGLK